MLLFAVNIVNGGKAVSATGVIKRLTCRTECLSAGNRTRNGAVAAMPAIVAIVGIFKPFEPR